MSVASPASELASDPSIEQTPSSGEYDSVELTLRIITENVFAPAGWACLLLQWVDYRLFGTAGGTFYCQHLIQWLAYNDMLPTQCGDEHEGIGQLTATVPLPILTNCDALLLNDVMMDDPSHVLSGHGMLINRVVIKQAPIGLGHGCRPLTVSRRDYHNEHFSPCSFSVELLFGIPSVMMVSLLKQRHDSPAYLDSPDSLDRPEIRGRSTARLNYQRLINWQIYSDGAPVKVDPHPITFPVRYNDGSTEAPFAPLQHKAFIYRLNFPDALISQFPEARRLTLEFTAADSNGSPLTEPLTTYVSWWRWDGSDNS